MDFQFSFSDEPSKFNDSTLIIKENDIFIDEFNMTLTEFFREVGAAFIEDIEATYVSPILPKNCLFYKHIPYKNQWTVYCIVPAGRRNIHAFDDNTAYLEVGCPRLLIRYDLVENEDSEDLKYTLCDIYLYALNNKSELNDSTPIYKFPFSNVHDDGKMCLGVNKKPYIKKLYELETLHEKFLFGTIFTNHFYGETNYSSYSFSNMLEYLQEKDFPHEWLVERKITLSELYK